MKEMKQKLSRTIDNAKQNYRNKLERCFQSKDSKGAWKCLEMMTDYKAKGRNGLENIENEKQKANKLNEFFCRFENNEFLDLVLKQIEELRAMQDDPIVITEHEVFKSFNTINPRKASGPDGISGKLGSFRLHVPTDM